MLLRKISCLGLFIIVSLFGLISLEVYAQDGAMGEKILEVFHPYRNGVLQVEGITPGMKINKGNFQVAEKVLPPEILQVVQTGDLEITVRETTDFPLREEYIAASIEHFGQAQLGEDGELKNYTKGLPFPLLDPADSQAGLKAAWNFRYRDMGDSIQTQGVLNLVNASGKVERGVETRYARLYGMHRLNPDQNVPEWEKEGAWWKEYSIVLRPQDLEGAQSLTFHYDADNSTEDAWAYDPRTRRNRKIVYNLYQTSFGLNFLVEDHAGFNGRIHAHTWQYKGEQVVLVPGIFKGKTPTFGGKNDWYPMVSWELRKVIILDVTPKENNHPYGKRRLYIDRQTFSVLYGFIYDDNGDHWRTLFHCLDKPKFVPGNDDVAVPLFVGNIWIDYKINRASLWVGDKMIVNQPVSPKIFTTKELLRRGK